VQFCIWKVVVKDSWEIHFYTTTTSVAFNIGFEQLELCLIGRFKNENKRVNWI